MHDYLVISLQSFGPKNKDKDSSMDTSRCSTTSSLPTEDGELQDSEQVCYYLPSR